MQPNEQFAISKPIPHTSEAGIASITWYVGDFSKTITREITPVKWCGVPEGAGKKLTAAYLRQRRLLSRDRWIWY